MIIILMFFVVALNVCGHVFLKVGMNQVGQLGSQPILNYALRALSNIFILMGLTGWVSSAAGYTLVLSRIQLSIAYPILMSSGYALVVLVSFLWLKEPFSTIKWFGLIMILSGVMIISIKG